MRVPVELRPYTSPDLKSDFTNSIQMRNKRDLVKSQN